VELGFGLTELALLSLVLPTRGAGAGKVGGVLEWSKHNPQMQVIGGKGSVLRLVFLDCSLWTSAMMSSTGRSAGHGGGTDCAITAAFTITTAATHRTSTPVF